MTTVVGHTSDNEYHGKCGEAGSASPLENSMEYTFVIFSNFAFSIRIAASHVSTLLTTYMEYAVNSGTSTIHHCSCSTKEGKLNRNYSHKRSGKLAARSSESPTASH